MGDTNFPCRIWFLSNRNGVTRSEIAVSETSRTYRIAAGTATVPKVIRFQSYTLSDEHWTADRERARQHDENYLKGWEGREREKIEKATEELNGARANLGRITKRRNRWAEPEPTP